MTKLMEWLLCATAFIGVWTAVITGTIESPILAEWRHVILPLPVILLFLFVLYASTVVIYRVFTFNDCKDAAEELQRQIEEAKAELRIRGILS